MLVHRIERLLEPYIVFENNIPKERSRQKYWFMNTWPF